MAFKFSNWKPNKKPVPKNKRPVDRCAPVPPDKRLVPIQERDMDMIERRRDEILRLIKKHDESLLKLGRNVRRVLKKHNLRAVQTTLGQIVFPITIQRPEKEDHIIGIMAAYDAWFFGMPLAGWDPIAKKFAVDEGQQRLLALRDRIRLGQHPDCDPDDWENYPITLQVIDLEVKKDSNGKKFTDYSPLRLRFIIENDRKLRVSDIDKLVNEVHGKLTDSPNAPTLPEYEKSAARYLQLKSKGLTPADSSDDGQKLLPGAFTAVRYLRNNSLTNEDIDNICDFVHDHMPNEPVADMQVLPVKWLHKINNEYHWYDANNPKKVAEFKKFKYNLNATAAQKRDFGNWQYFATDVWSRRMKRLKSNTKIPDEFSMLLLIQMTKEAGYMYPGIDPTWYTAYTEGVSSWDVLRQEEKDMFSCLAE